MKKRLIIPGLLILVVALPLLIFFALTHQIVRQKAQASMNVTSTSVTGQTPQEGTGGSVISRHAHAFASSGYYPASDANDDSYDTTWRSQGTPAWLAYDLSSVPASQRSKVLVVWYNETANYDHTIIGYTAYNLPQDYTIDVNPAPGGGSPPGGGWVGPPFRRAAAGSRDIC